MYIICQTGLENSSFTGWDNQIFHKLDNLWIDINLCAPSLTETTDPRNMVSKTTWPPLAGVGNRFLTETKMAAVIYRSKWKVYESTNARVSDLVPKWVRLAPNGTNSGLFQNRFQYLLACETFFRLDYSTFWWNVLTSDLIKSWISPIWANLTHY